MVTFNTILARTLQDEMRNELDAIARWWATKSVDNINGGFFGEISDTAIPILSAPKGVVMTARILWFFSKTCNIFDIPAYRAIADRGFQALRTTFTDEDHGGVYWSIEPDGTVLDSKKQTYAQAFGIYAYAAYYKLTGNLQALASARALFDLIEEHCFDPKHNGYSEALSRDWSALEDVRLSEFDENYPFSMNTHLHILEAYTELYIVDPTPQLKQALSNLIEIHLDKLIRPNGKNLGLFFDRNWQDHSEAFSHGHDIETGWLLWDASLALDDKAILKRTKTACLNLTQSCYETAMFENIYVMNETHFSGEVDDTAIWWVQAESLIGFLNAYNLSKDGKYYEAALNVWDFIQGNHIDLVHGEWHWTAKGGGGHNTRQYKAGMWKAPYHNGRAMLESLSLFETLIATHQDVFEMPIQYTG